MNAPTVSPISHPLMHRLVRVLMAIAIAVVLIMAVVLLRLKSQENDLVFRAQDSKDAVSPPPPLSTELRVDIPTAGGDRLGGILLRASPQRDTGFWILHMHGNADSAFSPAQRKHIKVLHGLGFSVLAFDYRGFGLSPGEASEAHIYADADAAYQFLVRSGALPRHIILWGHSLGGGPATYLAAQNKAAALVLFGAFTSVPEAAQDAYPYLPVKWAASIQFNSLARIPDVHLPLLIAHSVTDKTIFYRHAQALFAAANQPKELLPLQAAPDGFGGHVDALYDRPDLIADRLSKLLGSEIQR